MHVHASAHAPAKRFQPACWSSSQQAAWVAWVPCRPPPPHTHTRNTLQSRRDDDTSHAGRHRAPVWNQDFQFLVEDPATQTLDIWIGDSPMTGRTEVGTASFPLQELAADGTADVWLPVESSMPGGWPFRGGRGGC
jgi:hypothetical protein